MNQHISMHKNIYANINTNQKHDLHRHTCVCVCVCVLNRASTNTGELTSIIMIRRWPCPAGPRSLLVPLLYPCFVLIWCVNVVCFLDAIKKLCYVMLIAWYEAMNYTSTIGCHDKKFTTKGSPTKGSRTKGSRQMVHDKRFTDKKFTPHIYTRLNWKMD